MPLTMEFAVPGLVPDVVVPLISDDQMRQPILCRNPVIVGIPADVMPVETDGLAIITRSIGETSPRRKQNHS
jgi:hypothetical protein